MLLIKFIIRLDFSLILANGFLIASLLTNTNLKHWMGISFLTFAVIDSVFGLLIMADKISFLLETPILTDQVFLTVLKFVATATLLLYIAMTSVLMVSAWRRIKLLETLSNKSAIAISVLVSIVAAFDHFITESVVRILMRYNFAKILKFFLSTAIH